MTPDALLDALQLPASARVDKREGHPGLKPGADDKDARLRGLRPCPHSGLRHESEPAEAGVTNASPGFQPRVAPRVAFRRLRHGIAHGSQP